MDDTNGTGLYTIGVASRRSGLSEHMLRAWERRYGVVEPDRTPGGQRLYSEADILRLRLLRLVTEHGHPIRRVAQSSVTELLRLLDGEVDAPAAAPVAEDPIERLREACVRAMDELDGTAVYGALTRAIVTLTPARFVEAVAIPLLREVGERWKRGEIGPAQEHVLSAGMRRALAWLADSIPVDAGAASLVIATPAGQRHEFGAMLAAVVAAEQGWRAVYLGADLPAKEIAAAARLAGASAVAISVIGPFTDGVVEELLSLRARLPQGMPVLVGGRMARAGASEMERAGVSIVADFPSLRSMLRAIGPHEETAVEHRNNEGGMG
jgi:MerR family transcriptional regulator, light-induced transcriptional regulator